MHRQIPCVDSAISFTDIQAIAAGNHKPNRIAAGLEMPQTNLPKYVKTLIDLDILEREGTVTEENPEEGKKACIRFGITFSASGFALSSPIDATLNLEIQL